jgi:serine/threonine protein phosphatase PrpC
VDSTTSHDSTNYPAGRSEQDRSVRQDERPERQDERLVPQDDRAVRQDLPADEDDREIVVTVREVIQPVSWRQSIEQALPGVSHLGEPGRADTPPPVRPERRDRIDIPHPGQQTRPAAPPPSVRPEQRDRIELPNPEQHTRREAQPPVRPEQRDRIDMPYATAHTEQHIHPDTVPPAVRPEQRDRIELPQPVPPEQHAWPGTSPPSPPPVRPEQRDRIELPQTAPAVPEAGPDEHPRGIPEPVILVGNPRLGSAPGSPPRAKRSPTDSVLDGARTKNFTVRAASLRGDEHRYNCDPRQDSIGLWTLDRPAWLGSGGDLLLLSVADGVGNCPLSHLGSAEACWLLRQHVEAHLQALTTGAALEAGCRRVIDEVAAGLRVLADNHGLGPKDVSTTLIAALIIPASRQQGSAASALVFCVGDSPGFVLRERRWISIPEKASTEEAVYSTGTDALPTRPETCRAETRELFAGDMLMLCSDGLSTPMEHNENVQDQLADWWGGEPPSLPEFYWQMSFRAQTYGDDRSAVCAWVDV